MRWSVCLCVTLLLPALATHAQSGDDHSLYESTVFVASLSPSEYIVCAGNATVTLGVEFMKKTNGESFDGRIHFYVNCTSTTLKEEHYECGDKHRIEVEGLELESAKEEVHRKVIYIPLHIAGPAAAQDHTIHISLVSPDVSLVGVDMADGNIYIKGNRAGYRPHCPGGCVIFTQSLYFGYVDRPVELGMDIDVCDKNVEVKVQELDTLNETTVYSNSSTTITLAARHSPCNFTVLINQSHESCAPREALVVVSMNLQQQLDLLKWATMMLNLSSNLSSNYQVADILTAVNTSLYGGCPSADKDNNCVEDNKISTDNSKTVSPTTSSVNPSLTTSSVNPSLTTSSVNPSSTTSSVNPSSTTSSVNRSSTSPSQETQGKEEQSSFMTWGLVLFISLLVIGMLVYIGYHNRDKLMAYTGDVMGKFTATSPEGNEQRRRGRHGPRYSKLPRTIHETVTHDD